MSSCANAEYHIRVSPNVSGDASVRIVVGFNIVHYLQCTRDKLQIQLAKSTSIIKFFIHMYIIVKG